MLCNNCKKPIRTGSTAPYCNCRIYANSRPLSYVLVKGTNRKILVKQPLWVIAQGGTVGLLNDGVEIKVVRRDDGIYVAFNGERIGRVEYISLPPFVEKLLAGRGQPAATRRVTVIASGMEAEEILSTPGATLRAVENGKATITVPL
jgi:hypothetical protein